MILPVDPPNSAFRDWADRWMALARFSGPVVPDEDARISALIDLWNEPIPGQWKRGRDQQLLGPARYRRGNLEAKQRPGEHAIEYELLAQDPPSATCLGGRLIDGINAVPLAKDEAGGRSGNVEADMLLLVEGEDGYLLLLVEVKVRSNNAWYAAVENLRQLKLFSWSDEIQVLFQLRQPGLGLPKRLPVTAVVLAPAAFYSARGAKTQVVAPTQRLLERAKSGAKVDARLATWDPARRTIMPYPPS